MISIKSDFFNGVLNDYLENFVKEGSSKYLSSLTNDINILNNDFFKSFKEILGSLSCFIFAIIVMEKGEITIIAAFNELINHKGIFTELLSY